MKMLRALLLVTSLAISFGSSYAQTQPKISIYAQIVIQDSNGNLVAYLESARIDITDLNTLSKLIDQNPNVFHKSAIALDDQRYDLIKATSVIVHSSATIVSGETISNSNGPTTEILAQANHDGYPVVSGDKVTTYWTMLRPAS